MRHRSSRLWDSSCSSVVIWQGALARTLATLGERPRISKSTTRSPLCTPFARARRATSGITRRITSNSSTSISPKPQGHEKPPHLHRRGVQKCALAENLTVSPDPFNPARRFSPRSKGFRRMNFVGRLRRPGNTDVFGCTRQNDSTNRGTTENTVVAPGPSTRPRCERGWCDDPEWRPLSGDCQCKVSGCDACACFVTWTAR